MGSVCASTCGYDDKAVWVRLGKMERGCTAGARGAAGDQDSRGMRTWLTRSASNLKRRGGGGGAGCPERVWLSQITYLEKQR